MAIQEREQALTGPVERGKNKAERVEITFYTDPLCCWSWAFEPQWRRLQFEYADTIAVRYVMTGLLPSWKNYNDPVYSVSKPMQMGPVWLEASETSGMPIYHRLWVEDPPASSYPACIAVKTAQLQSEAASVSYLRCLREAVMLQGKNIAKQDILLQVAKEVTRDCPGILDVAQFAHDLTNEVGIEAFRPDWQEAHNRNISRTPTLIMRSEQSSPIMLTGYRPYNVLLQAFKHLAPDVAPAVAAISANEYKNYWKNLTEREIAEVS